MVRQFTTMALFLVVTILPLGASTGTTRDLGAARHAELDSIALACKRGQHADVVRRSQQFLAGAVSADQRLAGLSLLGTSLAGQERWEEASSTLAAARKLAPRDPVLASLQFNCHTTAYGFDKRAPALAAEMGRLLAETAKRDTKLANELLFGVLDIYVSPEVLAGAYRFALQQASRKAPAQNYFDGFVGGEVYLESLQNGARDLDVALKATHDRRWQQASSAFWRSAVDVDSASDGYPHEAAVLHPLMLGADAAAAALAGDFGRAASSSGMATRVTGRSPLGPQFRSLANLVTPLRGSLLDKDAQRPGTPQDLSNVYVVPNAIQSAVDLQAFSTIINNW